MKKLAGITIIVLLISFSSNAQQRNKQQRKGSDFTTEQIATLKVKQMTLALDLDASQQKEVYAIMKTNAEERKTKMAEMKQNKEKGVELTSDQKFEMQSQRLDKQIAHKAAMKNILSKDQYEKWSSKMDNKMMKGKNKMAQKNKGAKKGGPNNGRK